MSKHEILTRNEVCALLRVSRDALDHAGKNGLAAGPPFHRVGRNSIRYLRAEVMEWLTTSERRLAM